MFTVFIRTFIMLFTAVVSVRLMGKRQIGQLQPAELTVTILLSEVAAAPVQDTGLPLADTMAAILVLTGVEILMSALNMKSIRVRRLLQGNSVTVINNGKIIPSEMEKLRFTFDDLLEAMRQKDVFNIADVQYAVAETDGSLSILLKPGKRNPTNDDMGISPGSSAVPSVVVMDGKIMRSGFSECNMTDEKLTDIIVKSGLKLKDILLMTADETGKTDIIKRDGSNG